MLQAAKGPPVFGGDVPLDALLGIFATPLIDLAV